MHDVPVDAFFRTQGQEGPGSGERDARGWRTAGTAGDLAGAAAGPGGQGTGDANGERRYVVRRGNRAAIDIEGGVRWERLTPRTLPHLDFLQLVYGPHAQSNPSLYTHPGTEMVLVTSAVHGPDLPHVIELAQLPELELVLPTKRHGLRGTIKSLCSAR